MAIAALCFCSGLQQVAQMPTDCTRVDCTRPRLLRGGGGGGGGGGVEHSGTCLTVCAAVTVTAGGAAGRRGSQPADHLGRVGAGRHRPRAHLPGGHPPDPLLHLPPRGELSPGALAWPVRHAGHAANIASQLLAWSLGSHTTFCGHFVDSHSCQHSDRHAGAVTVLDGLPNPLSTSLLNLCPRLPSLLRQRMQISWKS